MHKNSNSVTIIKSKTRDTRVVSFRSVLAGSEIIGPASILRGPEHIQYHEMGPFRTWCYARLVFANGPLGMRSGAISIFIELAPFHFPNGPLRTFPV
jgi:hypothetical protein